MEKTERRNYKSDFDAIIRLKDCRGNIVPFPDGDWEAVFWTSNRAVVYKASRRGGVYVNCFNDNGQIHVVFKHHRLGSGTLKWEPHFELPNGIYPDGIQNLYEPEQLAIELVPGRGDCPATTDIEAILPYIKFKYEGLTDAEKAELQQPATEAAERLDTFVSAAEKAESQRVADEALRIDAEAERASQEAARERAEAARQANEAERVEAEADREEAETERESAETARAEEFASWETELKSKADRSELSNVIAQEPLTPDNFPGVNTYTREQLKMDLFIDMWNQAWGEYGKYDPDNAPDPEHPFMGNELWMTYEEAMRVYVTSIDAASRHITDIRYYFSSIKCRTLLPLRYIFGDDWYQAFANCPNLEILRITPTPHFSSCFQAFYGCTKLRRVYGSLNAFNLRNPVNPFVGCTSLEYIEIINLCNNIAFPDSPHLTIECLRYFIQRRLNNNTFTITVHPDVYAKLADETNTEWHQVLIDAAAKNITFATT